MVEKLEMQTKDLSQEKICIIGELFPNCITESKEGEKTVLSVDFDALRQELSDVIVEGPQERYQFTWPDKSKAKRLANTPTTMTLRPCREESVDFDNTKNLYIEGDNLEVLKILRETYLGKVKMIYIDPPYNTGNDFVYNDDFSMSAEDYSNLSGESDYSGNRLFINMSSNGRFHTDWLNMMYPRLALAKDLLIKNGVIFISIDENEITNLRKICDEIFGQGCFIGQITLLCNPKGRSQDKYIANCHEYILIYSKSILDANTLSIPKTDQEIKDDYPLNDGKKGPYRELELRNTHREFGRHNRPNLWYPFYVSDLMDISLEPISGYDEVFPLWDDGFEGCWTWGQDKAKQELINISARLVSGKKKIYRKSFAYEEGLPLKQVKSIWTDKLFFTEKGQQSLNSLFETKDKIFQSPKSVSLIKQCIMMAQDKSAIILDFFSGSGTVAQAVMELNAEDDGNRQFILVQIPEICSDSSSAVKNGYANICSIAKERIRKAGVLVSSNNKNTDVGFRVFKCDSSNMRDVFYSPEGNGRETLEDYVDLIKTDRGPEDLLAQTMLELGMELSLRIEQRDMHGHNVYSVDDDYLVACFDDSIDDSIVTEMSKELSGCEYAVFRSGSSMTDEMLSNIEQIFKTYSPQTKIRIL